MTTKYELREQKRLERLTETFRKIWGEDSRHMRFIGSPHEGEITDDAEIILHELAHQTLLPNDITFSPGYMGYQSWEEVNKHIENLPLCALRDLHEVKALAIELVASRKLRLKITVGQLSASAKQNTQLFKHRRTHLERLILRATKIQGVRNRADSIVYLVTQFRKGKWTPENS
jgi:hypothetical protein